MKMLENQAGDKSIPALRVVFGDEVEESRIARKSDPQQPLDSEAEEYWAGRFPAARHSTRIAA